MKKAERIYEATRWQCKKLWETYGYAENKNGTAVGFNTVHHADNEVIYNETLKAMDILLASDRRMLEMDKKLGIVDEAQYTKETQIYKMIEATISNARKSIALRG